MLTLYDAGVFLPLIAVNCAILGASLFMVERNYDFVQSPYLVSVLVWAGPLQLSHWLLFAKR